MSLISELRRRNVFRVAIGYVAVAWLLIQVVETLFPVFGLSDGAIRVVVIALAIGFLPAVVLAWVFQWSPIGIVVDDGSIPAMGEKPNRTFDRVVIAILAVALALFAVHTFIIDPSRDVTEIERAAAAARTDAFRDSFGDKSIAVLPFENLSSDPEQEFMADGLAEELLNLLARVPGLRVTSRTSSFQLKGTDLSVPQIADQLGVAFVLEGSIRRAGDRIRITAQLIDAHADAHLWSDTYDRVLSDIFAIQDDVAAQVVQELKLAMDVDALTTERHDPAAYTKYLRAVHLYNTGSGEQLQQVVELLNDALALEPGFVGARVLQAWAYWDLTMDASFEAAQREEFVTLANAALDRAAQDAPNDARVNAALAWFRGIMQQDLGTAVRYLEQASRADPRDPIVMNICMFMLLTMDRAETLEKLGTWAIRVDPLNYWSHVHLANGLSRLGKTDATVEQLRIAASLRPDDPSTHFRLGQALLQAGQPEVALAQFDLAAGDPNYRLMGRSAALHDLGRAAESDATLDELVSRLEAIRQEHPDFDWSSGLARLHAWRGEADQALHYLGLVGESNPHALWGTLSSPMYQRISHDPRFQAMVREVQAGQAAFGFDPTLPPEVRALK